VRLSVVITSARTATGLAEFQNAGSAKVGRYRLVQLPTGWVIDDIKFDSIPSLRKFLAACR